MRTEKKRPLLNLVSLFLLLLPLISCSGSGTEKIGNENGKSVTKTETVIKSDKDAISKTTCTDCHKVDKNGELQVSIKKFEGAKPPEKGGSTK